MERCSFCKKKAMCMFKCSCTQTVCLACRMPETHACSFDYTLQYKALLELRNPKVEGKKLDKL